MERYLGMAGADGRWAGSRLGPGDGATRGAGQSGPMPHRSTEESNNVAQIFLGATRGMGDSERTNCVGAVAA